MPVKDAKKSPDALTVKEYAAAAGISQAAVYKRLSGSLLPYTVTIDGKKHIRREALEDLREAGSAQDAHSAAQATENGPEDAQGRGEEDAAGPEASPIGADEPAPGSDPAHEAQAAPEGAADELARLIAENERLRGIIAEKDAQIYSLAQRFADIADRAQVLTGQAQMLHAADKPELREGAADEEAAPEPDAEPPRKRSFWAWLTGR